MEVAHSPITTIPGIGTPDGDGTFKILCRCYEKGLIVIPVGANVLRLQPPLNIPTHLLEQGFAIIDEAMTEYERGQIGDAVLANRAGW